MVVVIGIGVPMWWKTTEVYRVTLPSADILSLNDQPFNVKVRIGLFTQDVGRGQLLLQELEAAFERYDIWQIEWVHMTLPKEEANVKTPAALESHILKRFEISAGDFMFMEWHDLQEEVLMTTERSALIRSDTSSSKLHQVIHRLVLQSNRINEIVKPEQGKSAKHVAPQAEYNVVVSVLNPRPDVIDAKWNVRMAVETYLSPFLSEVSQISNFTLKTQWKYQFPFETELKQVRDNTKIGRHYALMASSLPHIITSIEKNLAVEITDRTAINLIVYIPPCDIAPLHIYDKNSIKATANNVDSFISPKWGGIIIANPPMDTCIEFNEHNQMVSFYVNTNDVMQIMLHHLHKLLDISIESEIPGVSSVALEQIAPRRWEYEGYIRRSAILHITTATNTLQSLIKLLDNISYIVINDKVGAAVEDAYKNILLAKKALADRDLLTASAWAKSAFLSSEQAFFDASLLAQLYFPEEQKYAIYIPLFLPVMVPVITSFSSLRKMWKERATMK